MADMRGWTVVVIVVLCMQMAQGCIFIPPRPKPCPGKPSETVLTTEKKPCIFPFLDADGTTEFTNCTTLEGYSNEYTYCATSLNADCSYKELGLCLQGGCECCSQTKSSSGPQTRCDKGCEIYKNMEYITDRDKDVETTEDMGQCLSKCEQSETCFFWVYMTTERDDNCHLMNSKKKNMKFKKNVVSGTTGCSKVEGIEGCKIRRNIEIEDGLTYYKEDNTATKCIHECGRLSDCKYWVYNKDKGCAYSAENHYESENYEYFPGITGSKGCPAIDETNECIIKRNIEIEDTDIGESWEDSLEGCISWCGEYEWCQFWVYKDKKCALSHYTLKDDGEGENMDGYFIGNKFCATLGCVWKRNIMINFKTHEALSIMDTESLEECILQCGENKECKHWLYYGKKCSLLKYYKESDESTAKGYISGTKGCAGQNQECEIKPNSQSLDWEFDGIKLDNLPKVWNDGDQDDCSVWCGSELQCKYWIYKPSELSSETFEYTPSQCVLYDSTIYDTNKLHSKDHVGYIYGNKYCALTLQLQEKEDFSLIKINTEGKLEWAKEENKKVSFYDFSDPISDPIKPWEDRCGHKEEDRNPANFLTEVKLQNNKISIDQKLANIAIRILAQLSFSRSKESMMTETVAVARVITNNNKIKLYLAGNLEDNFRLSTKKRIIMQIIKSQLDGQFDEVIVINPNEKTYEPPGGLKRSHYHAEMQIVRYVNNHLNNQITHIGVSKTPCCACNTVLRKTSRIQAANFKIDGDSEYRKKLMWKHNAYNDKLNPVPVTSGPGKRDVGDDKYELDGSQFGPIDIIKFPTTKFGYWIHPADDNSWKHDGSPEKENGIKYGDIEKIYPAVI